MIRQANSIARRAFSFVTQYKLHVSSLCIFGFLGLASVALEVSSEYDIPNSMENWELPQTPSMNLTSSLEAILANPLFGGEPFLSSDLISEAEEDLGKEELIDWHLVGIVFEGLSRTALIEIQEAGRIEAILLGDFLPGGETLEEIGENWIVVKQNENRVKISLFTDLDDTQPEVGE